MVSFRNLSWILSWILLKSIFMGFSAYKNPLSEDFSYSEYVLFSLAGISLIQGLLIFGKSRKFILWTLVSLFVGFISFWPGLIIFYVLLFGAGLTSAILLGFGFSGVLVGCCQSLIIRGSSRYRFVIPVAILSNYSLWPRLVLLIIQVFDQYSSISQFSAYDWIQSNAICGAFSGAIESVGFFYILRKTHQK